MILPTLLLAATNVCDPIIEEIHHRSSSLFGLPRVSVTRICDPTVPTLFYVVQSDRGLATTPVPRMMTIHPCYQRYLKCMRTRHPNTNIKELED